MLEKKIKGIEHRIKMKKNKEEGEYKRKRRDKKKGSETQIENCNKENSYE